MAKAKMINLALQGGGAHGAFTWGVIDRFLEDGRIEIAAMSGTSAGAMNAVLTADGLVRGGPEAAREKLKSFWKAVSEAALASPIRRSPLDVFLGSWSLDSSPGYALFDVMTRFMAPGQFNPLRVNPLRDILLRHVDFENVCGCQEMKVFVAATNVETGQVKVFDRETLDIDRVMASACLPFLFEAVEIDGVPYWDGGYTGNPPLFPLYRESGCSDIAIVQINPVKRAGAPKSAQEILNRMNEITFNTSLLKELRALDFIKRLLAEGSLDGDSYRDMNLHVIESQEDFKPLGASSKLNAEWAFLTHLRDRGRDTASEWLKKNFGKIGSESTIDLMKMFDGVGHYG